MANDSRMRQRDEMKKIVKAHFQEVNADTKTFKDIYKQTNNISTAKADGNVWYLREINNSFICWIVTPKDGVTLEPDELEGFEKDWTPKCQSIWQIRGDKVGFQAQRLDRNENDELKPSIVYTSEDHFKVSVKEGRHYDTISLSECLQEVDKELDELHSRTVEVSPKDIARTGQEINASLEEVMGVKHIVLPEQIKDLEQGD